MKLVDYLKGIFSKRNKQLPSMSKTPYQEIVEGIDDLDLCDNFLKNIPYNLKNEIFKYGNNPYEYELQTKISESDTIELVKEFFENFDEDISKKINEIIEGKNSDIILTMDKYNGKGAYATGPNEIPIDVYVPIRGDIRQLYELIHELTHTLDIENGDTETRMVIGEVAPQCMERMLDEFLENLSDEKLQKYGFSREALNQDIIDRNVSTFADRYKNAEGLLSNNPNRDRIKDSRYMLAQIYQSQFNKYGKEERVGKLKAFIDCVKNNNFEEANKVIGLKIKKENIVHRDSIISYTIGEIENKINHEKNDLQKDEKQKFLGNNSLEK